LVSDTASSSAEFPPPTTIISLSVKKSPSQVAQYEIPCPLSFSSPGTPIVLDLPPVVIIIASEVNCVPSDNTTFLIFPFMSISPILILDLISHPKERACFFIMFAS
jgi:hypothetical protein